MTKRKIFFIFCTFVLLCLITGYSLFQISKSRTFQFFGTLVDHVQTNQQVVALTFDDAPTDYTDSVLQTLQEKNIKATFFAIGSNLEKYPEKGKNIVSAGHEIGNHSYTHQRFLLKSQSFIDEEIQETNKRIRDTGYNGEIFFRPPNGKKLIGLPWYLMRHNIKTIMWDVEPDSYGNTTQFLTTYTLEHTKPGSIILLHPFCKDCSAAREAIPIIIDELRKQGYQFVTISKLLEYR